MVPKGGDSGRLPDTGLPLPDALKPSTGAGFRRLLALRLLPGFAGLGYRPPHKSPHGEGMASIKPHGPGWRAQVRKGAERDSRTFRTRQEAARWALQREAEMTGARLPDKTWGAALAHYRLSVTPTHRGSRWEAIRLAKWEREDWAGRRLPSLRPEDFIAWRDSRLQDVQPATVRREMGLLRAVLVEAVERRWLRENPMQGVKRPVEPPSRKRRISDEEVMRVMVATGLDDGDRADTAMHRTGLAFLFALETAMRAGEIVGMEWPDVAEKSVRLPRTKNGDERRVPLSPRAREILAALPRTDGPCFDLHPGTRDALWRKATAGIGNLHFHDARAEAIWRLSKKLDVLELARVIGHRDLKSLLIYYQVTADELADKL